MRSITVNLSDKVIEKLQIQAAAKKLPLSRYLKDLLSREAELDLDKWRADRERIAIKIGPKYLNSPLNREETYQERIDRVS
ncbi:MAG: hypothetical protein ABL962_05865 [Fimbriimonadaceae bacterium]